MPFTGPSHSPSLQKEGTMRYSRASQRRGLSMGRLIGDPFALATVSIGLLAWLIAFVAGIIAAIHNSFPNYGWWALCYTFLTILGIVFMVAGDAVYTYHVAAVGFLSVGLWLTTSMVNSIIYSPNPAEEAAAAGFILLSIVEIIWIFYFGSQPQSTPRQFIDGFALHQSMEDRPSPRGSRQASNRHFEHDNSFLHDQPRPQYTSSHLPGFETSSPIMNEPPGHNLNNTVDRKSQFGAGHLEGQYATSSQQPTTGYSQVTSGDSEVPPPTEYPFKARAIYSYEANTEDPNEISFAKHEILEVSDVSGRWWQARKSNGETGIAPSNYLILL